MSSRAESVIDSFLFKHQNALENLPLETLNAIKNCSSIRMFESGEPLYIQEHYAKGAFILKSGLVKISNYTFNGQRQLVYIYAPGDWMGYRQVITQDKYPVTATAIGNVTTEFINDRDFNQLLNDYPRFSSNILKVLSYEFSAWISRLTIFTKFQIRARVALCLLLLHNRFALTGEEDNVIYFSRGDLADFIGATVETTVRMLSEFKAKGWVSVSGRKIVIQNLAALEALIEDL